MSPKCRKCGYEAGREEFRFLNFADSAGTDVYRLCPSCRAAVYCEEMEEDEKSVGGDVWGAGSLRGKVFRRSKEDRGKQHEDS